ncbi:hypothetical protein DSUL_60206 [Desulfovibrionales bacterium]
MVNQKNIRDTINESEKDLNVHDLRVTTRIFLYLVVTRSADPHKKSWSLHHSNQDGIDIFLLWNLRHIEPVT